MRGRDKEMRGTHRIRFARFGQIVAGMTLAALLSGAVQQAAHAQDPSEIPAARGPISVDEAVRLAMLKNHDLLSNEQNIRAAAGRKAEALQRYLPSLSADLGFNRAFDGSVQIGAGQSIPSSVNTYTSSYVLSQNLVDWSAFKSIQSAKHSKTATEFDYRAARGDLVLAVKQQYYALVATQLLETVADSSLVVAQQELRRVESLFELGMVARGDVLKAKVRVSEAQLEVLRARGNVVNERARLARIIGQNPTDDLHADDRIGEVGPVAVDSVAIFNEAVSRRPELMRAQETVEAANASVGAAKAGYYPTLGGQLAYRGSREQDFSLSGSRSRSLCIGLSIPVFDAFWGQKGRIQQSQADREQARYAFQRQRLDVEVEVREAINIARTANEGVLVARDGLDSAEEDLKLSQEKYNVGSGTILELIDAQVALQRARSNLVQALTEQRIAEARIERVRGVEYVVPEE